MKKEVKAELRSSRRVVLSGTGNGPCYDDNTIRLSTSIISGPEALIDRFVTVDIGISQFVDALPYEVAVRLFKEMSDRSALSDSKV